MIKVMVDPAPAKMFVLAGDIQGFSKAYTPGNKMKDDVETFIARFYQLVALGTETAGGALIKYTGDGFMSVWPLPNAEHQEERGFTARIVSDLMFRLSLVIRLSDLGVNFGGRPLILRQGVAIEPEGLHLTYERDGHVQDDYLGRWVTLAFRLQGLAGGDRFPFIVADNHFHTTLPHYVKTEYRRRPLKGDDLTRFFKGNSFGTDQLWRYKTISKQSLFETMSNAEQKLRKEGPGMTPTQKTFGGSLALRSQTFHTAMYHACENGNAPDWLRAAHRQARVWLAERAESDWIRKPKIFRGGTSDLE
jgi:class 3 adenylate cyclase